MLERFYKDRRRAQAGTTLVELLVSLTIMGLALVLIVGDQCLQCVCLFQPIR